MYHQEAKTIQFVQDDMNLGETYLECRQGLNFKHNTKHITVVSFSILLTKCVEWNT